MAFGAAELSSAQLRVEYTVLGKKGAKSEQNAQDASTRSVERRAVEGKLRHWHASMSRNFS